jgi:hypothetical protein
MLGKCLGDRSLAACRGPVDGKDHARDGMPGAAARPGKRERIEFMKRVPTG